jgi:hypothetical protein
VRVAHRDGAYAVKRRPGGIPVELVAGAVAPHPSAPPHHTSRGARGSRTSW